MLVWYQKFLDWSSELLTPRNSQILANPMFYTCGLAHFQSSAGSADTDERVPTEPNKLE